MKSISTIILFFYCSFVFSQTNEKSIKFLSDQSVNLSIEEIKSSFTKSLEEWINDDDGEGISPFLSSIKGDVFSYFSLNETYDSELKKSIFKKTSEYKHLFDSLTKIKTTLLKQSYYQVSLNQVYQFSFEYDMKNKGFLASIGEVLPYHCMTAFLPKVIGEIEFKQLSIIKKYNLYQSKNSYTQYLFFPMTEENAIEIENNKENIEYLLVFNIQGVQTTYFNDQDFIKDNQQNCKTELAKGSDLRFIVYNEKSNQIYIDKLYKKTTTK